MNARRLILLLGSALSLASEAAHADNVTPTPCQAFESGHGKDFVVIFNATDRTTYARSDHRYGNERVLVCIDNPDLRYRYSTAATFKELPPDPSALNEADWGAMFNRSKSARRVGDALRTDKGANPQDAVDAAADLVARIAAALNTLTGSKVVGEDQRDALQSELRAAAQSAPSLSSALKAAQQPAQDALTTSRGKAAAKDATDADKAAATKQDALVKQIADLLTALPAWLIAVDVARRQLAQELPAVFQVSTPTDKDVTITVRSEKLIASTDTPPKLSYDEPQELGTAAFQSRSLSYVRVGLGLAVTGLRDRTYRIGPNEIGAPVIQSTESSSLLPVVYFTQYWAGADTRDPSTPWNDRVPGWKRNFLPTLTVGIPLSRSPLENIFFGGTLQLVPGIAFSGGVHIGRVTRLRSGFTIDTAPPSDPAFRIEDATSPRLAIAPYLAVIVTDSLFVGAIQKLSQ